MIIDLKWPHIDRAHVPLRISEILYCILNMYMYFLKTMHAN